MLNSAVPISPKILRPPSSGRVPLLYMGMLKKAPMFAQDFEGTSKTLGFVFKAPCKLPRIAIYQGPIPDFF